MVRAVQVREFGDPTGLEVVDVPAPSPAAGEVLIRTEAIGVSGVDVVARRGELLKIFPPGTVLGSEAAGVVIAAGDGVDPVWVGRRVWAFTGRDGAYADQVTARLDDITELPSTLSFVDAVAVGSSATVAHFALEHAHFTAGESVLIRGAAGSIGLATIELAVRNGASSVAVTTSSESRAQRLKQLGATHVLDRTGADPHGTKYDVIVDIVAGPELPVFIDKLAPNGRLVMVGAVSGFPAANFGEVLIRSFQQSRSVATFSLDTIPVERRNQVREALLEATTRGELTPVVHDVLPLERAADAHRQMDDGSVFGRIVLIPTN
ncbi:zinc-dependent alcohol dehydrogenase family protein [Kribbella sp. NPDC048915]|uniref:zinc-dependent alcohol dehydrogenase family protein n=1 Tax=Kribbella sp. NPDC048915 TaxID=3155148 RepID=UPI0033DECA08